MVVNGKAFQGEVAPAQGACVEDRAKIQPMVLCLKYALLPKFTTLYYD